MTANHGPADYRERVQQWLAAHASELGHAPAAPDDPLAGAKRVQALLYDAGFVGITWPQDCGGQGRSSTEQVVFDDEAKHYRIANHDFAVGLGMCGPTIRQLGTDAQRHRYLPPLLRGDEVWCQLFSEPGAGSDVAALQTSAVRDGAEWVINGQKTWTSGAHVADYGILLARTDPTVAKHEGITMFIVDMRTPGITVRGLRVATGQTPFCEVFLDDVRLPLDAVVGDVDGGWAAAVAMLKHERVSIGGAVRSSTAPLSFVSIAAAARERDRLGEPALRRQLADLYVRERALALFNQRMQEQAEAGGADLGLSGAIGKYARAALDRVAVRAGVEVLGTDLAAHEADTAVAQTAHEMIGVLRYAIGGGTNQIQLNIIAERLLGLPKDPGGNRGTPFNELRVGTVRS